MAERREKRRLGLYPMRLLTTEDLRLGGGKAPQRTVTLLRV